MNASPDPAQTVLESAAYFRCRKCRYREHSYVFAIIAIVPCPSPLSYLYYIARHSMYLHTTSHYMVLVNTQSSHRTRRPS